MNDEEAVQLILSEFEQPLDSQKKSDLNEYLAGADRTRQFAELARQIEVTSKEYRSFDRSGSIGPGINEVAKARLQRALQRALSVQKQVDIGLPNYDRLVAESEGEYSSDTFGNTDDIP